MQNLKFIEGIKKRLNYIDRHEGLICHFMHDSKSPLVSRRLNTRNH